MNEKTRVVTNERAPSTGVKLRGIAQAEGEKVKQKVRERKESPSGRLAVEKKER
jgi:hypothetical protein